jgi:Zn-dependent peptidase ImmA (M78 family)
MVDSRAAILTGAKAASRLQRDLGIREQVELSGSGRVDVFGAIAKLGATLMFQPLDKLLGAYLPGEEVGVLITTKRPLSVQRFTGAHELGHLYMRHKPSLDDENILQRSPFSASGRHSPQEREADAFASMFLTPRWLLALNLERQGWTARDLRDPANVYQASLRLGTSYLATCYALERHKVIGGDQRASLIEVEPKKIKQQLLTEYQPPDWRSDVWLLTQRDEGALIEGGRNDLFVVRPRENSGAGYLWNFDQLRKAGFALVHDDRKAANPEAIGGVLTRKVTARSEDRVQGEVVLQEARPWMTDAPLHQLLLRYDMRGPESPGMWEPELKRMLRAS